MREISTQVLGLVFLIVPLVAIRWNLAGVRLKGSAILAPEVAGARWRLEIYSVGNDAASALTDPADMPFPVKRVRSSRAEQAKFSSDAAWMLPQVELDVEVADPFDDDSIAGLLGVEHRVLFVTGNEAVVHTDSEQLRILRFRFG